MTTYESKITDAYSKNLKAWTALQADGKWAHGNQITDEIGFVPASLCRGYEEEVKLLQIRMEGCLDEFLRAGGCHFGNQSVCSASSRYFDGITVEGKEQMIRSLFRTCNEDERVKLLNNLVKA